MSNPCLVTTVSEWLANDCTAYSEQADASFFDQLFSNFYSGNSQIWVPGIGQNNNVPTDDQLNFQNLLADVCNLDANGGKCSTSWLNQCQSYVRNDTINPTVRKFCGCYLPSSQYNQQTQRTCDLICSGFGNVQYFPTPTSTSPQPCASNVCVIDDVTIQAVNSSVGQITFQQLCQNCGVSGQCQCIVEDINIISTNSNVGELNLQQNCGASLQCFATVNGASQPVDCNQYLSSFSTGTVEQQRTLFEEFIIVYFLIAFLVLILLIVAFVAFVRSQKGLFFF